MEKTKNFLDKKLKQNKKKTKIKKAWLYCKKQLIIIFMLISSSISLCIFYAFRNEEKLVAIPVYSSFRRVFTSGIRNKSVTNSSITWN